ncbi:hypothetical protein [Acrocarpospora catenulata]|uniref:hypothetical protein n=1 Tax=Acrocarpospora catenulata TaxID=2836182 RepID=UPI001BDA9DC5|nr:hypothetical protein [Acrocarpospora catenulata]
MNEETLLKETLRGWSEQARVPDDLAERALARRRRRFRPLLTAVAAAAALVTAIVVPGVIRPVAGPAGLDTVASPAPTDIRTDTRTDPPARLIAAKRVALSAYYLEVPGRPGRRWHVYNPVSGRYERTDWAWVDVAPGLRTAAVLERGLPVRRVGLVDLATSNKVSRWIELPEPAGAVVWSPDGARLLVTTYSRDPDARLPVDAGRTGYAFVDVATGEVDFHPLTAGDHDSAEGMTSRRDFGWSDDGALIWEPQITRPGRVFYDQEGNRQPTPPGWVNTVQAAGVSPDGRLIANGTAPDEPHGDAFLTDLRTGRVVSRLPALELLAWADDDHLVVSTCQKSCKLGGDLAYYLMSVDGGEKVRLSADRQVTSQGEIWYPLFTLR